MVGAQGMAEGTGGEMMNYLELAGMLDGVTYRHEVSEYVHKMANENGLVIIVGASDDLMELYGAIDDEVSVYGGGTIYLNADGLVQCPDCEAETYNCPYFVREIANAQKITAVWNATNSAAAWTYVTDIPHGTFRVFDDGDLYCIGIVFSVDDLK